MTLTARVAGLAAWLLARLLAVAAPAVLATLAAVAVLRFHAQGDALGIAAAAVIVGILFAFGVALLACEAVNALAVIAGAAVAAADALEEIEKSAAGIEHTAGLLEESADVAATALADQAGLALPDVPPGPLVPVPGGERR